MAWMPDTGDTPDGIVSKDLRLPKLLPIYEKFEMWLVKFIGLRGRLPSSIVLGTALMGFGATAWGQAVVSDIIAAEGFQPIRVAVPRAWTAQADAELVEWAATLRKTLIDDLTFSRLFALLPEAAYDGLPPYRGETPDVTPWKAQQVQFLVLLKVGRDQQQIWAEARLWDVATDELRLGRRYTWNPKLVRQMAHHFADEILAALFGIRDRIFTSKIAFSSTRDGNPEIYVMDYDGENQTRITRNDYVDLFPDLRPRHHQLVFTSLRQGASALVLFDLITGQLRTLVDRGGLTSTPQWSPDGQRIAFVGAMDGNAEIYVINADGTGLRRLTFSKAIESSPAWSPSGNQIAFTSDRSGRPQIYVMDADGGNVRQLTFFGEYNDRPAWSPDGARLAFVSRQGLIFDIYVLDLTTNEVIRLTENQGSNESPAWGPDGIHLVFASNRTGRFQIYTMDRWGRDVRQLTHVGENKTPTWRPFE